jgi:hypothetical protein
MTRQNATSAKPLPRAERKARLDRMVASGELSAERAKLIHLDREPTAEERAFAETLGPRARRALERHSRQTA